MSGTLYLVGTPIGNLGDLSVRALETLRSADFIAAEDTRVTAKLLNHFEIKKPCVSYYEHNKYASGEKIVARLLAGETCALVTDAGMPAISDPGEDIVRQCAESGDSEPFFRAWGMKESEIKLNRGGSGWRLTLDEESRPVVLDPEGRPVLATHAAFGSLRLTVLTGACAPVIGRVTPADISRTLL